ncbi:hypothetical protein IW492_07765 [Enterococcus sp. BWB1-3]|uniref:hypothetical protein n=1 Tax=Enterococcus sp. BWB1-3 TaxID=2787713 RepID=UPI001923C2E7|nr:hypothetical protein [Enterococcus sp. BWB1-3]MBL1229129.1 hypothetical protein [Enterococcus sp. BWB1-3]
MNEQKTMNKANEWPARRRLLFPYLIFAILAAVSLFGALRIDGRLFFGDDLNFHLGRIEGLAQSLGQGDWLPKINYFITGGMGYATGIFYPDFFLYPAALLRIGGLSLVQSYSLYLYLVSLATFVIAYQSFLQLRPTQRTGACLFAVVYGLSTYRLTDVLYRAALGEVLAFMVFPLILVGGYQVVCGDQNRWFWLTAGMTGLFYGHLLSTLIACLFLALFCLRNVGNLIRAPRRLWSLAKAAGCTLLLTMAGWAPMVEQLVYQKLRVAEEPIFYLSHTAESLEEYWAGAVSNLRYNNLGIWVFVVLVVSLMLYWRLDTFNRQLAELGTVFLFLATNLFPHHLFDETFFNVLQFPWRYFLLVSLCFSWVVADGLLKLFSKPMYRRSFFLVLSLWLLGSSLQMQLQMRASDTRLVPYESFEQMSGEYETGAGREFLPAGMESWMTPTTLISEPEGSAAVSQMSRENNIFSLSYETSEPVRLIFPVLLYKGYTVSGTGMYSKVRNAGTYKGTSMHGFAEVEVNGRGELTLWYQGTWIQKISLGISLLTGIGLLVWWRKADFEERLQ